MDGGLVVLAGVTGAAAGALLPRVVHRYAGDARDAPPHAFWAAQSWLTVPLCAALTTAAAAIFGNRPDLPAFVLLCPIGLALVLVDLRVMRLPNPLVLAALCGGLGLLGAAAAVTHNPAPLDRATLAGVACLAWYAVLALLPRAPLGMGDVKFGAVLGVYLGWLGWWPVLAGVALAPLLNLPFALATAVLRRSGGGTAVAYGPAMFAAALLVAPLAVHRIG